MRVLRQLTPFVQTDIPDIYAFAAHTRGVFVNIALTEPFGLTLSASFVSFF